MQPIYLICGVPGAGKSWAARQLKDKFEYVAHDRCWTHPYLTPGPEEDPKFPTGAKSTHFDVLLDRARKGERPIVSECPFAERELVENLRRTGINVVPVFVIEEPHVVARRYFQREHKTIPPQNLTRAVSIKERAKEWRSFHGTSEEVLNHLKGLSHG
jgi:gluconate kinase